MFKINQIVRGTTSGHYVVMGYRPVGTEIKVCVKRWDTMSGLTMPGEMVFAADELRAY